MIINVRVVNESDPHTCFRSITDANGTCTGVFLPALLAPDDAVALVGVLSRDRGLDE